MGYDETPSERASRFWEYRLHQEQIFYQRLNFFLVAESMHFVAFATMLSIVPKPLLILTTIVLLGIFLTGAWTYVNHRQKRIIDSIRPAVEEVCKSYKELRSFRPPRLISSWNLLAYWVPLVTLFTWLVFFFAT